jgi:hypothetical protein
MLVRWLLVPLVWLQQSTCASIVNRELETSVIAYDWPTTPQNVYCEAYAHHCKHGLGKQFLDALVSTTPSFASTEENVDTALQRVLKATPLQASAYRLLQVVLYMRANSPFCELHRGLARETLGQLAPPLLLDTTTPNVFGVVGGRLVLSLETFDWDHAHGGGDNNEDSYAARLLPDESTIQDQSLSPSSSPVRVVVLYANLGTLAFASAYKCLLENKIPFVVRHLGAVGFEENRLSATGTVLQGFGVRLDIRNVEYKVFDDRSDGSVLHQVSNEDLTDKQNDFATAPFAFLAGVNLTALGWEGDKELYAKLWTIHNSQAAQSAKIPPAWRRRDLPLQAATAIMSSQDPLFTLQQVSQDLPSLASTLVHLAVPDKIRTAASFLDEALSGHAGYLYVNGRAISFERPSFNVFEVLNVIHEEQLALERMQKRLGPFLSKSALEDVQKARASSFLPGRNRTN